MAPRQTCNAQVSYRLKVTAPTEWMSLIPDEDVYGENVDLSAVGEKLHELLSWSAEGNKKGTSVVEVTESSAEVTVDNTEVDEQNPDEMELDVLFELAIICEVPGSWDEDEFDEKLPARIKVDFGPSSDFTITQIDEEDWCIEYEGPVEE